ncbi:MAG: hypothetical protein JW940_37670 [Polyangiaceae bacterium]|nr:hypothetical protein [Polyangiaceae bacterium]
MKDLSPHARRLLADARATRVPASSKLRVRRALAASVAAGISSAAVEAALAASAAAGTAGSAAAGHGVITALAVWGGAGIATGVAVTAASVALLRPAPRDSDRPTPSVAARPRRSTATVPAAPVVRAPPPVAETSTASAPDAVARLRHPGVAQELSLLAEARAALRDGDPERALALTQQHEQRFGEGALAEEALAARILALCALGRREQGRAAVATLERLAPNSPQLPRARAACADSP